MADRAGRARYSATATPDFEGAFHTETSGEILIVRYPGPPTGERLIYVGRFSMEKRTSLADERVDR